MKNYTYTATIVLLLACGTSRPMLFQKKKEVIVITLPTSASLKERLVNEDYRSFCKATRIYRKLGEEKLSLPEFVEKVSEFVGDYNFYNASIGGAKLSTTDRSKIMRAMLEGNSQAITWLEQNSTLK
jgi:hypothetical protein